MAIVGLLLVIVIIAVAAFFVIYGFLRVIKFLVTPLLPAPKEGLSEPQPIDSSGEIQKTTVTMYVPKEQKEAIEEVQQTEPREVRKKYCFSCGAHIMNIAAFCSHCGSSQVKQPARVIQQPPQIIYVPTAAPDSDGNNIFHVILGIIVIIILLRVAGFFLPLVFLSLAR